MKADPKTEAAVRKAIARMAESYEKRSRGEFMACFSAGEDVTLFGTGADENRRGPDAIRTQVERDWNQTDAIAIRLPDMPVSAAGDVAWACGEGTFEISAGGQSFSAPARASFVLERQDGTWRIAHAHFSAPAAGQEEGSSIPG